MVCFDYFFYYNRSLNVCILFKFNIIVIANSFYRDIVMKSIHFHKDAIQQWQRYLISIIVLNDDDYSIILSQWIVNCDDFLVK